MSMPGARFREQDFESSPCHKEINSRAAGSGFLRENESAIKRTLAFVRKRGACAGCRCIGALNLGGSRVTAARRPGDGLLLLEID